MLGSAHEIRSSGFGVRVTTFAEGAAYSWMRANRVKPSQVGPITNWNFDQLVGHWAGVAA
jgi:hypothetical protein